MAERFVAGSSEEPEKPVGSIAVGRFRKLSGLAAALTVLLWAWAIMELFIAIGLALAWSLRNAALFETASFTDTPEGSAVAGCLGLVCAVVLMIWKYRATANLWTLRPREARIRPGWAVGWYFVPIANLWMPYRAMNQLADRAYGGAARWWSCILGSAVLSALYELLYAYAETRSDAVWALRLEILASALAGIGALILIRIVKTVTWWQGNEWETHRSSPAEQTAPR